MRADQVKSAKARATIAANLLKHTRGELGRAYDACFEMNDGGEVVEALKEKAKTDMQLLKVMLYDKSRYVDPKWTDEVLASIGKTRADVYYAANQ